MNIALKDEVSELTEMFSELEPQARKTVIDLVKLLRPDKQNKSKPKESGFLECMMVKVL